MGSQLGDWGNFSLSFGLGFSWIFVISTSEFRLNDTKTISKYAAKELTSPQINLRSIVQCWLKNQYKYLGFHRVFDYSGPSLKLNLTQPRNLVWQI